MSHFDFIITEIELRLDGIQDILGQERNFEGAYLGDVTSYYD